MNVTAAVLHVNPTNRWSSAPTVRIARFVADALGIPLLCDEDSCHANRNTKFDVLFVKFGVLRFCAYRDIVFQVYQKADLIINLENDYAFKPDPRLLKLNPSYTVWSTVPKNCVEGGRYINWNKASWIQGIKPSKHKHWDVLYHGRWRDDREALFARYFDTPSITVSAHSRSQRKFLEQYPRVTLVPQLKDITELRHADLGLYLEDVKSSTLYCSPAQRFYECVQAGVPVIFDSACIRTFYTAGYGDVSNFAVGGSASALRMLRRAPKIVEAQAKWYRDYGAELRHELMEALAEEGLKIGVRRWPR